MNILKLAERFEKIIKANEEPNKDVVLNEHPGSRNYMDISNLLSIQDNVEEMLKLINEKDDLPQWLSQELATAKNSIEKSKTYIKNQKTRPELENGSFDKKANSPFGINAKLTESSREKLIEWFEKFVGTLHPVIKADHMTIVNVPILRRENKKAILNPEDYPIGKNVKLKVIAWGQDEKCQAVAVDPIGIVSKNKIPHIIVALNGAPAKYSNELLEINYNPCLGPELDAEIVISYS